MTFVLKLLIGAVDKIISPQQYPAVLPNSPLLPMNYRSLRMLRQL